MYDWAGPVIAAFVSITLTWFLNRRLNRSTVAKTGADAIRMLEETTAKMSEQIKKLTTDNLKLSKRLDEYTGQLAREVEKRKALEKDNLAKAERIQLLEKQIADIVIQHDREREQWLSTIDQLSDEIQRMKNNA